MLESHTSRAHSAELVEVAAARIAETQGVLAKAQQDSRSASSEVAAFRTGFAKQPPGYRLIAFIADVLGIKSLIPSELAQKEKEADRRYREWCGVSTNAAEVIVRYGGNLPGEYVLNALSYDANTNRFGLGFTVRVMIGSEIGFFDTEGVFGELLYRTTRRWGAKVRIPKTDTLSPVLYFPEKENFWLAIRGYDGPGSIGNSIRAFWRPKLTSVLRSVDPKEFIL